MKKIEAALTGLESVEPSERLVIEAIIHALAIIVDKHKGLDVHAVMENRVHRYTLSFTRRKI